MKNGAVANRDSIRCAVYTRKSTEEGLEKDFNSLDAQREAAESYIASQRHEGWICLPDRYDDGGFTGANIERPALKRLLAHIEEGCIDAVMVYKVDRLSRSLLDFSKLMEVFDRHGVSFVSVTQQFNTTHSMGRLTLNILLSFAQFEREMIAERTRDKMSAARRKGKWVGGTPVLGYDVAPEGGKLLVNEDEAAQVRAIYQLYLDHEALLPVVRELDRRGWHNKRWTTKRGDVRGGRSFTKDSLYRLLRHMGYIGKIDYHGTIHEGEHQPIIDPDIWKRVQATLGRNGRTGGREVRNKYGAILKGLLYCIPCGAAMIHVYTRKKDRQYRYYVCQTAQQKGWERCPSKSLNAHDIETAVLAHIRAVGTNQEVLEATASRIKEQNEARLAELSIERRGKLRELKRLQTAVQRLLEQPEKAGSSFGVDRLADLQDQIGILEQRLTAIGEETMALQRETLDENDLARALAAFDPIWESLTPKEQARMLKLLVERVGYDGREGTVTVTFRSPGIKALCQGHNSARMNGR